jgi:hypothetical protein
MPALAGALAPLSRAESLVYSQTGQQTHRVLDVKVEGMRKRGDCVCTASRLA